MSRSMSSDGFTPTTDSDQHNYTYMEAFEDKAHEEVLVCPKMWFRYVDDTSVVWKHGQEQLERFQEHLNNRNKSIQFTKESEGVITFLDVKYKRNKGKSLRTGAFLKENTYKHVHPLLLSPSQEGEDRDYQLS